MADLAGLDVPFPLFVKPNAEGSNMGVFRSSLVRTREELESQVTRVLSSYRDCLVEAFAPGIELCFGLLGNDPPEGLAIAQVCIEAQFFAGPDRPLRHQKMICPVDVPAETAEQMRVMTLTVFHLLGCRDLARADFMLDAEGRPTFLEVNPLPSLSPAKAVYPLQARAAGIAYDELIARVIEAAVRRTRAGAARGPACPAAGTQHAGANRTPSEGHIR
jgi:D-alanine-D-alanine ligase